MPVSVMGFSASNSAENEWCAKASPPAAIMTATPSAAHRRTWLLTMFSSQINPFTTRLQDPYHESTFKNRAFETLRTVVLTEMRRQLLAADPAQLPARSTTACVYAPGSSTVTS